MTSAEFVQLMTRDEEEDIDLAYAALLIAKDEYPNLDVQRYLDRLDKLAYSIEEQFQAEHTSMVARLNTMLHFLFDVEEFRGNEDDYYDPRNSFLNDCLDRKLGIPITLSVITLEVGWRLGLPLVGVGFPGHFLIKFTGVSGERYIDPYVRGSFLTLEECQERLDEKFQGKLAIRDEFLSAVSKKDILTRILNNLKSIYLQRNDHPRALHTLDKILLINPLSIQDIRDRGLVLFQLERTEEAKRDLEQYLAILPESEDAPRVLRMLKLLQSRDITHK